MANTKNKHFQTKQKTKQQPREAETGSLPVDHLPPPMNQTHGKAPAWMTRVFDTLNNQILTMLIVLLLNQIIKKHVNLADERVALIIQTTYYTSQAALLLSLFLLRKVISTAQGVEPRAQKDMDDPRGITVKVPANPWTGEPATDRHTSVRNYDLEQLKQLLQQTFMQLIMMYVLSRWFKVIQPLVMQCILPWKSFLCHQLVRIWLFGEDSESVKRPFQQPKGPLQQFLEQQQEQAAAETTDSNRPDAIHGPRVEEIVEDEASNEHDREFDVPPQITIREEDLLPSNSEDKFNKTKAQKTVNNEMKPSKDEMANEEQLEKPSSNARRSAVLSSSEEEEEDDETVLIRHRSAPRRED